MALDLKSIEQLRAQILNDIESFTNQSTPAIEVAYNRILSNAVAGVSLTSQLYALDRYLECFPQTASEKVGLPLHAELKNTPRKQATQSQARITIAGEVGATVGTFSTGPQWASNGYLYNTSVGGTIGATGELDIEIISVDSGSKTTLSVDQVVSLTTTIPTLNNDAVVKDIITIGQDEQSVESWRTDIIRAYAFPPDVGTASYFYNKSLEVDGITRCFPYVDENYLGRVILYLTDDSKTGGIPDQSQIDQVEAIFTTAGNDVMWAFEILPNGQKRVNALASTVEAFIVTIQDGQPPLSETLKLQIEIAIDNYFNQREPYINGLSLYNYGYVSKTDLVAVAQNVINSQAGSPGRFVELEVNRASGGTSQDIYTLAKGSRASGSVLFG